MPKSTRADHFHALRDVHIAQIVTILKSPYADAFHRFGDGDILQMATTHKRTVGDLCYTFRNGNGTQKIVKSKYPADIRHAAGHYDIMIFTCILA